MATSYTSLLGLALPVTGELQGTWGDVVNNYITSYIDASVAGTQTISGSQTAVTLSVTNGTSLTTVGSGATGSAQFQIINCTGNPGGLLTITAPASSRQYIIINATSTNQSVKIVGSGPTTGVTLVAGEKAHVAWNGSDFVKIATQSGNGDFVTVDTTNLEVTNIKAKDGTAALSIADSTGAVTVATALTANGGAVFNENGANVDFRVEGDTDANLIFADASTDRVGVGTNTPASKIHAFTTTDTIAIQVESSSTNAYPLFSIKNSGASGREYVITTGGSATGLPGALLIRDATAEANRLTITSGGQVNIGGNFTSTNNTLQVTGNAAIGYTTAAPTTGLIVAGNVGIGTDSPGVKLDIAGNATVQNGVLTVGKDTVYDAFINSPESMYFNVDSDANSSGNKFTWGTDRTGNTGGTTWMTLDSSGNLGLGVTPSAWGTSSQKAIEVILGALSYRGAGNTESTVTHGAYYDGTNWKYAATSVGAARYQMIGANAGSSHTWSVSAGGTKDNTISFTQAMTLDASGNLGVGQTNPSAWLVNGIGIGSGTADWGATIYTGTSSSGYLCFADGTTTTDRYRGYLQYSHATDAMVFATAATERARITSGGNLGVGTTSPQAKVGVYPGTTGGIALQDSSDGTRGLFFIDNSGGTYSTGIRTNNYWLDFDASGAAQNAIRFFTGTGSIGTGTERARITSDGNLLVGTTDNTTGNKLVTTNTIAFSAGADIPQINYYSSAATIEYVNRNSGGAKTFSWYYAASGGGSPATLSTSGVWTNSSDIRGKTNVSNINYGLETVSALQARQFDVKSDGTHRIGFIAQELLELVPEVVHVTMTDKNGDDWYGVDYGAISAVLVKAIQEQQVMINELKAEVAALKGA